MIRSTSFVDLAPTATDADVGLLGAAVREWALAAAAVSVEVAPAAPTVRRGADLILLVAFDDEDARQAAQRHPQMDDRIRPLLRRMASHIETVRYHQGPTRVRDPHLSAGIQRTLALRVDPATPTETVEAFERDLADMHHYIEAIRNSSLSRVDEVVDARGPVWTHVWEQEYETIEGLTVDYMRHAYHWACVDTWFDPQAPNRIVDRTLVHVACDLRHSILGGAPASPEG